MFYELTINKSLHDNFIGVWEKRIKEAIKMKQKMKIIILENGIVKYRGIVDPTAFMKTGQRVKRAYYRPDEPMVFYENYIKPMTKEEMEEAEQIEFCKSL